MNFGNDMPYPKYSFPDCAFTQCDAQQHTDIGWTSNSEIKLRILRPVCQIYLGQVFSNNNERFTQDFTEWRLRKLVRKMEGQMASDKFNGFCISVTEGWI